MDYVLRIPSYGWEDAEGALIIPTNGELLKEFFSRLKAVKTKKNWLAFYSWMKVLLLIPCLFIFFFHYFSFPLFALTFIYGIVVMGTHGTIWYHRYCTHHAYIFSNRRLYSRYSGRQDSGHWEFVLSTMKGMQREKKNTGRVSISTGMICPSTSFGPAMSPANGITIIIFFLPAPGVAF